MGGRMSGESPQEEKLAVPGCTAGAVRPYQTEGAGDITTATVAKQASTQQLEVCNPLEQHDFCEASRLAADEAQSDGIGAAAAAIATSDPCRPSATITIKAMIRRLTKSKIPRATRKSKLHDRTPNPQNTAGNKTIKLLHRRDSGLH
jgi:hypothetical protein